MWKFPILPEQASTFARQYDDLFWVLVALSLFFTALVYTMMLYFVIRYRRTNNVNRKISTKGHLQLEITWTLIPLFLGLVIFFWSAVPFAQLNGRAPANATEIFVVGKQWMWHIQHTNGVRENDELHIPVGQPIKLTMISQDVIHSFFIPAFRVKKDVVPGEYHSIWFTPTRVGQYHLFCAQYCGTQHSQMTGWVYVMEPKAYQQWLSSGGQRTTATTGSMAAAGEQLFNKLACVQCHGFAPARAPLLVGLYGTTVRLNDGSSVTADEAYIRESIIDPNARVVQGYQPIMPSYKDQLNEDEILQLVSFIKSLGPTTPAALTGTAGRAPTAARAAGTASQPANRTGVPAGTATGTGTTQ